MPCEYCCEKNENDEWINPPCCEHSGVCDAGDTDDDIGLCICCGAELFKENDEWFHHDQREIPYKDRGTRHRGK